MDDYEIDQIYRHLRSYGVDDLDEIFEKIENMKEVDMVIGDRAVRIEQDEQDFVVYVGPADGFKYQGVWKEVVVRKGDEEGWRSTIRKILLDEMRESERGIIVVGGKLGEDKTIHGDLSAPGYDLEMDGNDQKKTHNAGIHALDSLETNIRSIVRKDPVDMTELNTAFVDLRRWMIMVVERLCRVEGRLQILEGAHMNYCNSDENEFEHRHGSLPPVVKEKRVKDLQERIRKLKDEVKETIGGSTAGTVFDTYPLELLKKCPEPGCELWCGTPIEPDKPEHMKKWYCIEHGWFEPE